MTFTVCLLDCARVIEDEIAAGVTQKNLAYTYALAMYSENQDAWISDWPRVNKAIVERWSLSGLNRIKEMAHRMFRAKKETP